LGALCIGFIDVDWRFLSRSYIDGKFISANTVHRNVFTGLQATKDGANYSRLIVDYATSVHLSNLSFCVHG